MLVDFCKGYKDLNTISVVRTCISLIMGAQKENYGSRSIICPLLSVNLPLIICFSKSLFGKEEIVEFKLFWG